jgi:2-aminoethylphosphonate-pyruvate transaminase
MPAPVPSAFSPTLSHGRAYGACAGQIGEVVRRHGKGYLIDAMSSFGALPISAKTLHFDAVVSSANKCLEGVPGCAFAIVRRAALEAAAGNAHSLALDLHDQWRYMESTGCACAGRRMWVGV